MDILWQSDGFTVREVHVKFERTLAYTTVMTTLDRLYKKGFVSRIRSGRAFVYRASRTRAETEAAVTSGMLHGLLSSGAAMPILSNLVDVVRHDIWWMTWNTLLAWVPVVLALVLFRLRWPRLGSLIWWAAASTVRSASRT